MGGEISLTVSVVMIALFVAAILGFAINFANDNSAAIDIANDSEISSLATSTNSGIDNIKSDSEQTYSSIANSTVEPGSDVVQSPGTFTIGWSNLLSVFKNIINLGFSKIFGGGDGFSIFFTTIISVIVFIFALYIIKAWKGSP